MLGKLFKHEFKETGKLLIPLNLVIICYTIIGSIMLGSRLFENENMTILAAAALIIYIISLIAIAVITYVFFCIRFYRTMYSAQGYLTHTLPVSAGSIINTKILTSLFWMVVTTVMTVLSIFALVASALGPELNSVEVDINMIFSEIFDTNVPYYIIPAVILSCLQSLLLIYACLSIGQLFNQYRILASVVAYIVINIATQIIGTVVMFITQIDSLFWEEEANAFEDMYNSLFSISNIMALILCIILYSVCYYLTSKKLNLE